MAISRDDLHLCVLKSIQFSKNSAWTFIKHHPFVSFTLLFFSFLYLIFPLFFWALIHFLAFLIFLVSITSLYSNSKSNPQFIKSPVNADSSNHDPVKNRNGRPFVRARSVRQRKSRDTSRISSKHCSEDEKNAMFNTDMIDKNPCLQQQQNPKEIPEVTEEINGDNIETESSSSSSEEKNKGVQWTEDDEKNLMDLGFSEMERNKRLESLIARRRSRKMFSLQIRKALLNKDINLNLIPPPIAILKTKPFAQQLNTIGSSSSGQVSPTPGSAPPVLLPAHDPFDLPYDPLEEKPVLTGGSFHQEFIAADLHDAVLRRHESFCLGTIGEFKQDEQVGENSNQLEEKEDTHKTIEVESSSCQSSESNFNKETKSDHYITEEIQSPEKRTIIIDEIFQETENTEVETKSMVVDNPSYMSSSTSSDEDEPPFTRIDKEAILKSLTFPNPRSFSLNNNYDSTLMDKVIHHKPTHSIASDMQVEVSEIGSPPQMIDGSFSSFDIGSPIEEEDINYGNECLWELSSQISVNDEDKPALNEIYRLHDEYTIKQGSSRCKQSKDSGELHDLVKDMEEQDVSCSFSRPGDLCNGSQEHVTHESSQPFISGVSDFPDVENAKISTERDKVFRFRSDNSELLEEPSIPSTISMETNSFSSNIEPRVDDHERRQKETMKVPQNTWNIIEKSDTITDLHMAMEESNPSISNEINNNSEDSSDLVNQSNRLFLDTEEASNPSISSMEAAISLPKRTDFKIDEHEVRENEHREITQTTSTRINNLETMASPQQHYKEHESSSLNESNHESEDHIKHLARPDLANHNEDIDTQTPSSTPKDEKQNVTMEDQKNASSSMTSPITEETLQQETMPEINPSALLDNEGDNQESPHKHEVNQENALLVKTEESEPEACVFQPERDDQLKGK